MSDYVTPPAGEEASTPASQPQPQAPPPVRRKGNRVFWGVLSGCLLLFVLLTIAGALAALGGGNFDSARFVPGGKVAVLPLEGPIYDSREFIERLEEYVESSSVKAIVVRIDSPGGMVVPSQEMYEAVRRAREESGKPIVASIANSAASGGYYVAVACDPIVANRGSVTGSIGVIAQWFNYEELARWAKLDPQTIKSGRWKDVPNPLRELDEQERAYYQSLIDQLHGQFITAVINGRAGKLSEEQVRALADGRVFLGEQAVELKLADQIGTLDDAIRIAGEAAGLGDDPRVLYPKPEQPTFFELLAGAETDTRSLVEQVIGLDDIRFLYRWN